MKKNKYMYTGSCCKLENLKPKNKDNIMNLYKEMLYTAKDGTLVLLRYPLEKDSMQLMNIINELIDEHALIDANKK